MTELEVAKETLRMVTNMIYSLSQEDAMSKLSGVEALSILSTILSETKFDKNAIHNPKR